MKKCKCEENYVEIAELYKQGLSIDKLKDKYNVSNKVITGSKFITIASTKEFCSELKNILKNYGIKSVVSDTSKKDSNTKILRICGIDNIRSFLSLIYSDAKLYIKRKFNIYKKVCNIK